MLKKEIVMKKSMLLYFFATVCLVFGASARPIIQLYPDQPDRRSEEISKTTGTTRVSNVHTPTLTVFTPDKEKANGTSVVVCPGGGYSILAVEKEGYAIAEWFKSIGVTAFVLKYRLKEYQYPAAQDDALTAIAYVREHADEYNIDPNRIGIMGFSAGGHVASSAGTHFDSEKNRPDFMILIYPVISMQEGLTHNGSRNNLLGKNPSQSLVDLTSNEMQITAETPPTFLIHTSGDNAVKAENSVHFYLALRKHNIPAEMHIYEKGGHGYGMEARDFPASTDWPKRCRDWLDARRLLSHK
jgi:acetyl esterase/lipase